jgi:mannose PTS system EIIA component
MVGVVVVGHGRLGEAMVEALESVAGRQPQFVAVAAREKESAETIRCRIADRVREVNDGAGVIICTDMLGDTETTQALRVARDTGAEVLAGVNMPMLLKLCTGLLLRYGRDHICCPTAR